MASQRAGVAPPSVSLYIIAAIFVVGGVMHFVRPALYLSIVPPWLPAPMALVLISGAFELLGGVGVLVPATRVAAAWGLLALLVAVFPANVQMLLDARRHPVSPLWEAALWARLPLQPLLMWWIWRAAIRPS